MNCCQDNTHAEHQKQSCCHNKEKESCCIGGFFSRLFGGRKECCQKENKSSCKGHTHQKEMSGQCCKSKKHGTRNDVITGSKVMLGLLEKQFNGFSPAELAQQPHGVKNHPLWSIGHLALTMDMVIGLLGGTRTLDEKWNTTFGRGSQPVADASAYLSAQQLIEKLTTLHARACELYQQTPSSRLCEPNPVETLRPMLPTVGNLVVFLFGHHMGNHVGQVSAWRRAMGRDPLF